MISRDFSTRKPGENLKLLRGCFQVCSICITRSLFYPLVLRAICTKWFCRLFRLRTMISRLNKHNKFVAIITVRFCVFSPSAYYTDTHTHTSVIYTRGEPSLLSESSIRANIASKDRQSGTRSNSHVESVHRSVPSLLGRPIGGRSSFVFFTWQNVGSVEVGCNAEPVFRVEKSAHTPLWLMQRVIKARRENRSESRGKSLKRRPEFPSNVDETKGRPRRFAQLSEFRRSNFPDN